METDYTELTDTQLRQRINENAQRIADAVVNAGSFVISNELRVRGELLRELKRRNAAEAIAKMEDES
jgi:hypothetical protein